MRRRISGRFRPSVKYHYLHRFFSYLVMWKACLTHAVLVISSLPWVMGDPLQRQCQAGSLAGAVHLSNNNAGVPRLAQ